MALETDGGGGVGRSRGLRARARAAAIVLRPWPYNGVELVRSTLPMFRREKRGPGRAVGAVTSRGETL